MMEMKKILFGSAFALALLSSCSKADVPASDVRTVRITATADAAKTTLSGKDILWEETDRLCCIASYPSDGKYLTYGGIAPVNINGASAEFEVSCGGGYTPSYLVYPDRDISVAGGKVSIPVPSSYVAVKDGIPAGSNISLGKIEQGTTVMRNLMSLLKFEIENEGVSTVSIRANGSGILGGGDFVFDLSSLAATAPDEGSGSIILTVPDDEPFFPTGTYFVPVPACDLAGGFSIKVGRTDGMSGSRSYDAPVSFARNKVINLGKESDWAIEYKPSTLTLEMKVIEGGAQVNGGWPFEGTSPKIGDVCGKGLKGPFKLLGTDYDFYFYVANNINSDSWRTTTGGGFRFGGTVGDYMLMPAIDGFALSSVSLTTLKACGYSITDNPSSGSASAVSGGAGVTVGAGKSNTWTLSGTKPGTAYRLTLTGSGASGISVMTMTYEIVE